MSKLIELTQVRPNKKFDAESDPVFVQAGQILIATRKYEDEGWREYTQVSTDRGNLNVSELPSEVYALIKAAEAQDE